MSRLISILFFLFISQALVAQELNCRVQVVSREVQSTNRQVYETLQRELFEFVNNRKWTNENYSLEERIECTMVITINQQISSDEFSGNIQVQSSRPVYGSNYKTTILNYKDDDVRFKYVEFQQLDFNDNTHQSNLTSIIAYYIYVILAMDHDTFAPNGGEGYWLKAQTVVNNAQGDQMAVGWKAFDGNRNRYWLVENALSRDFVQFRTAMYGYHRLGLDVMTKDDAQGRMEISKAIRGLREVNRQRPNSFMLRIFFDAKADEIANVFKHPNVNDRAELVTILTELSPTNSQQWSRITSN
jgi:hypothetical protein